MSSSCRKSSSPSNLFTLALALLSIGLAGCGQTDSGGAVGDAASRHAGAVAVTVGQVGVTFYFPDARVVEVEVDIVDGSTVADVLRGLEEPVVTMQGAGAMTFVSQIGDFATSSGEGWSYRVNGQWADRSVGVFPVSPGDRIDWTYGDFDPPATE